MIFDPVMPSGLTRGYSTSARAFAAGSTTHEAMMVENCQADRQAEITLNGTTATSSTPNQSGMRSMACRRSDWASGDDLCGLQKVEAVNVPAP